MLCPVNDLSMPELDPYLRLTEAQLRSKQQPEKGVFIAESENVIFSALQAGYQPISMMMEQRQVQGHQALLAAVGDIPVYTGSREMLSAITGYELTRGILCAMHRKPLPDVSQVLAGTRRVAVLEGIVDQTNVGAIFRCAAALGMDALLLTPDCCDPLSRRACRVSMGTVFKLPWTRIGDKAADWPEKGIPLLKEQGFQLAAAALNNRSVSVDDPALRAVDRLAVVLGTEGTGIRKETLDQCDHLIMIPMQHGVDSLNVAAASAVLFWELRAR
ncbi:MAG: RNA methyltransferase [Clostridia bacterium]|nr:RNA methyltransferase [Clostridia bacterium]